MCFNLAKTNFFQKVLKFCGRILTPEGLRPSMKDYKKIEDWPKPKSEEEMISFLGLINYMTDFTEREKLITGPLRLMY